MILCSFGPSLRYLWITVLALPIFGCSILLILFSKYLFFPLVPLSALHFFNSFLFLLASHLFSIHWNSPCFVHFCSREIMYHHNHNHFLPCLHCHPHSYIRMVQHLIERCLLLHMNQQQCVKALSKYASIRPCITVTVWRELQKENRDFFHAYFRALSPYRPFNVRYIQRRPRFERKKQFCRK